MNVELQEISKGFVIVKSIDEKFGDTAQHLFEVSIPCTDQYWVKLGFYELGGDKIDGKGTILQIASEILDYCNN